jgi:hypothetical protein
MPCSVLDDFETPPPAADEFLWHISSWWFHIFIVQPYMKEDIRMIG